MILPPRGPACQVSSVTAALRIVTPIGSVRLAGGAVAPVDGRSEIETARAPRPSISSRLENSAIGLHSTTTSVAVTVASGPRHARPRKRIVPASEPEGPSTDSRPPVCSMMRAMTNGRPASDSTNATLPASASTMSTLAASDMCLTRARRRFGGGGASVGVEAVIGQNARPTEKWMRTCFDSWP